MKYIRLCGRCPDPCRLPTRSVSVFGSCIRAADRERVRAHEGRTRPLIFVQLPKKGSFAAQHGVRKAMVIHMAEPANRKKSAASGAPSEKTRADASAKAAPRTAKAATGNGKARASSASKTVTATTAEKKPVKSGGTKPRRAPSEDKEQVSVNPPRRHTFSEQFMPYTLGAVGLFLGACFALNAIGGAASPDEHLMGVVGYYICYFLFGCFGWTAYLIPLVLFNLAIFWKRYCEGQLVPVKLILSLVLMVLLSAVIHVAVCASDPAMAAVYDPGYLYRTGANFESGGLIGGLTGYVLYLGLRLPGTVVLAVVTLPLVIMCLVGVTPAYVFGKLWASLRAWRTRRAEARQARAEQEATEASADKAATTREAYRARRAKLNREAEATSDELSAAPKKAGATGCAVSDDTPTAEMATAAAGGAPLVVDPMTGEVLGTADIDRAASTYDTATLPVFEPTATEAVGAAQEVADTSVEPVFVSRASHPDRVGADGDLPWSDAGAAEEGGDYVSKAYNETHTARAASAGLYADEEDGVYDGEPDVMAISLEDDADALAPTADEGTPTVGYELVRDDGTVVTSVAAGAPLTVRILQSDPTAVAEAGLSEEELVLPGAHADDSTAVEPVREYQFPSVDMLTRGNSRYEANEQEIAANTQTLRDVLESFHIRVKEISCSCGPTITRFEVKPDTGIRVRSIANLVDDIAMNLAKAGVRIEAPIPGKAAVGIEVPNAEPSTVYLRNILETPEFRNHKSRIAACLGADVSGRPVILDINKMPHLLIAGATGMGKSVCINSIIMSILYKAKPDEVKLILIDPKKVEFAMYRDLPHLYAPIVSDPKKAAGALNSAVNEMERRFELIEEVGVRNLAGYNEVTADDPERPPLPQMVIIIDELADLMMTAPSEVETAICRLAQKARAAGIHLIIGTQRPSVDVITGLIKANIPSRIAFTVASAVDSRTIIDTVGADKLIGRGDMLYAPVGATKPMRVQGTFVSESEVERVVTFIKEHNEKAEYNEEFTRNIDVEAAKCGVGKKRGEQMSIDDFDGIGGAKRDNEDPKLWEAMEAIAGSEKIGTSALQRKLGLGYGRAAKIIDRMEELGFVGADPGNKQGRKVYITKQDVMEYKLNGLPGSRDEAAEGKAESGDDEPF